jgi:hypothetical protein
MYVISSNMKSNSCKKQAGRNRYGSRPYNTISRNKDLKYRHKNNNTKNIRNVMYEYSKSKQNTIMYKKHRIYSNNNILEPVKNKTSLKNRSTNSTQVNSKVLCTWCGSTKYVAYTRQLTKVVAERGNDERQSVIYVCNVIEQNTVINTRKYSTSDITEMAEKNGQMDVDPEGLMLYGPYGKPIMFIYTLVLYVNITLMMHNDPKTDVCKYGNSKDDSVSVWCKKCRYVKMVVGNVCDSPESVVTKKWSARKKQ